MSPGWATLRATAPEAMRARPGRRSRCEPLQRHSAGSQVSNLGCHRWETTAESQGFPSRNKSKRFLMCDPQYCTGFERSSSGQSCAPARFRSALRWIIRRVESFRRPAFASARRATLRWELWNRQCAIDINRFAPSAAVSDSLRQLVSDVEVARLAPTDRVQAGLDRLWSR